MIATTPHGPPNSYLDEPSKSITRTTCAVNITRIDRLMDVLEMLV